MKYYIYAFADQTIILWSDKGWTTSYKEVKLYNNKADAIIQMKKVDGNGVDAELFLDESDEAKFRAKQDTW